MDPDLRINATVYQRSVVYGKDLGNSASILLDIWIYFNLIANNILLPILVLTVLISSLRRHVTFINMCITWILSGIFSLLLFYARQYNDSEPPKALCIAQSSLLYGITPMWSIAVLGLFYYVYKSLQGECSQTNFKRITWWFILAGPYFAQIAFSVAALVICLRYPEQVSRQDHYFYCGLHSPSLAVVRIVFVALCAGCALVIEALLIRTLYSGVYHIRRVSPTRMEPIRSCLSVFRVLVFGTYVVLGLAFDFMPLTNRKSVLPEMYMATAGAFIFVVFGTQTEILRLWFPCKIFRQRGPRRVSHRPPNRPFNRDYPDRLHGAQVGTFFDRPNHLQAEGGTQHPLGSPNSPSFSLDDLFPTYPEVARTAPVRLCYTHYSI